MRKKVGSILVFIFFVLGLFACGLWLSKYVAIHEEAQALLQTFGYAGIVTISFFSGLNIAIPIHAGAFVPMYEAAGFPLLWIIVSMVIGTSLADLVGYAIGNLGHAHAKVAESPLLKKIIDYCKVHTHLLIPLLFLWVAIIPLPNELVVIPLALFGVSFLPMFTALIAGNVVHLTAVAFGISAINNFVQ